MCNFFSLTSYIADFFSVLRIILIIPIITLRISDYAYASFALLCIAAFSDFADGYCARKYGASSVGKYLDPLADKLMLNALFWFLHYHHHCPFWFCMLVTVRDFFIVIGAIFMHQMQKKHLIMPLFLGKLTTSAHFVFLIAIWLTPLYAVHGIWIALLGTLTLYSFCAYLHAFWKIFYVTR